MKKAQLIETILEKVKTVDAQIIRVYGVPMGVGYDLGVMVTFKDGQSRYLEAHASNKAWAVGGHLRPNQFMFDEYKGSNAPLRYAESVRSYWNKKHGLKEYLSRFKKVDLVEYLEEL